MARLCYSQIILVIAFLFSVNGQTLLSQIHSIAEPTVLSPKNGVANFNIDPNAKDRTLILFSKGQVKSISSQGQLAKLGGSPGQDYQIWSMAVDPQIGGQLKLKIEANGDVTVVATAFENLDSEEMIKSTGFGQYDNSLEFTVSMETEPGDVILDMVEFSDCQIAAKVGMTQRLLALLCPVNPIGVSMQTARENLTESYWNIRSTDIHSELSHVYVVLKGPSFDMADVPAPGIHEVKNGLIFVAAAFGLVLIFLVFQRFHGIRISVLETLWVSRSIEKS